MSLEHVGCQDCRRVRVEIRRYISHADTIMAIRLSTPQRLRLRKLITRDDLGRGQLVAGGLQQRDAEHWRHDALSCPKPRHDCAPVRLQRSEEHTSELQSLRHLVCRLLLEKKKQNN